LLSDSELRLAEMLGLPTFEAAGMTLYRRLTTGTGMCGGYTAPTLVPLLAGQVIESMCAV
jgi:hypothetical protein